MAVVFRRTLFSGVRAAVTKYIQEVKEAGQPFDFHKELMLWDFTKEENLQHWDCICDADIDGHSWAKLERNKRGGAVFHGNLSTYCPPEAKRGGYAAIRSHPRKSTWYDHGCFDVSEYDALRLRVRGDGRKFFVNIQNKSMVKDDDVWQFFMFTRGGPHWEDITIPFHNFFVTERGTMQDVHLQFARERVTTFGILLVDRINGPFSLEIEHIKAVRAFYLKKV